MYSISDILIVGQQYEQANIVGRNIVAKSEIELATQRLDFSALPTELFRLQV